MTTTINNEHKKLNVPNLRFKEFQGEWEEHLLGNISDVTKLAGFEFTKYGRTRQTLWGGRTDANPKLSLNDT